MAAPSRPSRRPDAAARTPIRRADSALHAGPAIERMCARRLALVAILLPANCMRLLYSLSTAALVACAAPSTADLGETTQFIGKDKDTGEPSYPDTSDGDGGGGGNTNNQICRTITIGGHVFYNDLRSTGLFAERWDSSNNPGTKHGFGGDQKNYLGLRDAVIDFYEVDDDTSGSGCAQTSYVGGVTIDAHGSYSWTGQVCDSCRTDHDGTNDSGVSLAGRIRLRFCNDTRCFSVRDSLGMPEDTATHFADTFEADPYRRWLRVASLASPKVFLANTAVTLADDYFQGSGSQTPGDPTDLSAQAASVYASLVDTTRMLHKTYNLPYDKDRFGEVQVFYPSVLGDGGQFDGGGAHSHQPEDKHTSRICIESQMDGRGPWIDTGGLGGLPAGHYAPEVYNARQPEAWFEGSIVPHEYGHLVHYWQWDGFGKWASYCYQDPACEEDGAPEYVLTALKEGWADLVKRVVWNGIDTGSGCDNIDTRSPMGAPYPTPPAVASLNTIGRRWISDVEQTLCDIWDANPNSESATYGSVTYTDTANTSLVDMVTHLGLMWNLVTGPQKSEIMGATKDNPTTTPIGICDFVGERTNNAAWVNALKVNGIDCGL
jgi:hypothetical protein